MSDCVLFLGNGVNNISGEYRWENLIQELIEFIGASGQIEVNSKPFPLLYEEIIVESVRNRRKSELEVKTFIADKLRIFHRNEIHERIVTGPFKDILTTNYDYTIENAFMDGQINRTAGSIIKENLYSLFRKVNFNNRAIWHIHGEVNVPNSITLGYEHYAGYLQQLRAYIVTGTKSTYKHYQFVPIVTRLGENSVKYDSWSDFFFKKDIHIVGYICEYIEMELWWLLIYRARCMYTKKCNINNQIIYYYPQQYGGKIKNKLQLLRSSGVIPYSFTYSEDRRIDYYNRIFDRFEKGS